MTAQLTLVLIHGLSSAPGCWDRVAPALAERYRLRAVDLFDRSVGPRFSLPAAPDRLAEELADDGPAVIIGHSMRGVIAAMLAIRHPGLVHRLVIISAPVMPLPGTRLSQARGVLRSATRERLDVDTARLLTSALVRAGPLLLIQALRDTLDADVAPLLAQIVAPTLLIWGDHDDVVPAAVGAAAVSAIPEARLVLIPGARHMPMWEAPDAFVGALVDFVEG